MRLLLAAILALTVLPVRGDEVPFAQPAPSLDQHRQSYTVALSDAMELTQLRHIKLWLAGNAKNWPLANYELTQLKDTFDKTAVLYLNIPVEYIASVEKPLGTLADAVAAKDSVQFRRGFMALQTACNECHKAADVGFVVIQTPMVSVFPDEKFAPVR
ncbi:MAG TPA: hypothetical protein VGB93_04015 [Methylovirgula sp.]